LLLIGHAAYKILTFNLGMGRQDKPINNTDYVGLRYVIKMRISESLKPF